jgi:hypothetical protein
VWNRQGDIGDAHGTALTLFLLSFFSLDVVFEVICAYKTLKPD